MGIVPGCDDANTSIEVDWDPQSTMEYKCEGDILKPEKIKIFKQCENETAEPIHICLPREISYTQRPPTSGPHRPNWPKYGEYVYVPPQRWLHSLEHGAIVMLYHPCADPGEVERLRRVVRGCLRRHVITPYPLLPPDTPLALLSWGCRLMMSQVILDVAYNFILTHAIRGPEGNVAGGGRYKAGLLIGSHVVSDFYDTQLCPHLHPDIPQKQSDTKATSDDMEAMTQAKYSTHHSKGDTNRQTQTQTRDNLRIAINPVVEQSNLRRHQLDEQTDNTQRSIHRLAKAYDLFQKVMKP